LLLFFYPDYTVGFGIEPKSAADLPLAGFPAFRRFTAGGEFRPLPKLCINGIA
jgi:hypothetical protein